MKEKQRPTLMRILLLSAAVYLIVFLVFSSLSMVLLMHQEQKRMMQETQAAAQNRIIRLQEEMSGYERLIWEMLNSVSAEFDLRSADTNRQYFAKHRIKETCDEIMKYYPRLVYVFAFCPEAYFVGQRSMNSFPSRNARDDLLQYTKENQASLSAGQWSIETIAQTPYLMYLRQVDEQICGCLFSLDHMRTELGQQDSVRCVHLSDGQGNALTLIEWEDGPSFPFAYDLESGIHLDMELVRPQADLGSLPVYMGVLWLLNLAALLGVSFLIYQRAVIPVQRISGEFAQIEKALVEGKEPAGIRVEARTQEVYQLEASTRHLLDEVLISRVRDVEHQLQKQDMELLMVRSQIRPHFYLNALTTIDAMTYQNRNEDIRKFLQSLSVHVRYMLRTDENQITLNEELTHIASYLEMQQIRYPSRIFSVTDVPESLKLQVIPHLLLYTIVENSFKYALGVEDTLLIMIEGKDLGNCFSITVEDNGHGYSQEVLQFFAHAQIPQMSDEEKNHIGLRNVRRTLELRYGDKGRLMVENVTEGGQVQGARTTLIIPKQA